MQKTRCHVDVRHVNIDRTHVRKRFSADGLLPILRAVLHIERSDAGQDFVRD